MRQLLIFYLLIRTTLIQAQFSCDNIELVGIYINNFNTSDISIVLTNSNLQDDGNQNVYTGFQIITNAGDTLLMREPCFCYSLPNSQEDTIVYNLEIFEDFGTIYDLPDGFCGKIITQFPDCEIEFCKDEIIYPELPDQAEIDCNDYQILGLYPTAIGGISNYSMLISNTNPDYKGMFTGYTSFEFVNNDGISLSENTGPHFILPQYIQDTFIVHLQFYEPIEIDFCGQLKMENPSCMIEYCNLLDATYDKRTNNKIRIFPNPTKGQISIESESSISFTKLFDLSGRLIQKTNQQNFDISHFDNGVYIMETTLENNKIWKTKLIKMD